MAEIESIWITLFFILGFSSTVSNMIVCIATLRIRGFRISQNAIKYYIFSLAITDIFISTVCVSFYISLQIFTVSSSQVSTWKAGPTEGKVTNSIDSSAPIYIIYQSLNVIEVFLSTCSILHLCIMAFDRAVSVSKPLFHRAKMTRRNIAMKILCLPWIFSTVPAVLTALSYAIPNHIDNIIPILAVLVLVPLVFIISCYAAIFFFIRNRNTQISNVRTGDGSEVNGSGFSTMEVRMIKTLLCLIVFFLICWIPLIAINIIYPDYTTFGSKVYDSKVILGTAAKFLHYSNSLCNPYIYAVFNPVFRNEFKAILRKTKCLLNCFR